MQAVIFADRRGLELAPLCDTCCPALLPVANKPVLQYTIEDIAAAGIDEILLVVSDDADRIEKYFATGSMWGVKIRYLLSRGEETPDNLLLRHSSLLKPPFIAARGDMLRSSSCKAFMEASTAYDAAIVNTHIDLHSAGLCLVREWPARLPAVAWPQRLTISELTAAVELQTGVFSALVSLNDFYSVSLEIVRNPPKNLDQPGRYLKAGLKVERLSQIHPVSHTTGNVLVGENTSVHPSTRLSGPSIIGHNCYLDRGVEISNSVVMPGTYVGENLHVENAIVAGSTLIRIDRGTLVPIPDPMLLSDMEGELSSMVRQWPECMVAAVLLLLSTPLIPLALLLSLFSSPTRPLSRQQFVSNRYATDIDGKHRRVVTGLVFATRVPLLRSLPLLWLVIKGDLRLFGSTPLSPQRMNTLNASWDLRGKSPSSGLLGPAQLLLSEQAPEEEIRLTEIDFVANSGCYTLLARLVRAASLLFSTRTWRPVHHNPLGA
ncbi:MAG: NDP-sugar synthase [Gammaproteobacteria bacterium]